MLKEKLCRASFIAALSVVVCASGASFAQDGASAKGPVAARSIRPFARSEQPANQAPNLYDANSDEFDYFREDLGKQELSTKQKARLEALANRVVYADPMDKPAADGKPFVDIYSPDNVYADDEPFVGLDDPDVMYAADENNIFAKTAKFFSGAATALQTVYGASASTGNGRNGSGSEAPMISGSGPAMPMPTVTMDSGVAPGSMAIGVTNGGPGAQAAAASDDKDPKATNADKKILAPSKADDTALIFQNDTTANPFADAELKNSDDDFDFFSADREFVAKETAPKQQNGDIKYGDPNDEYHEPMAPEDK